MARGDRSRPRARDTRNGEIRVGLFDRVMSDPNPVIRYGFAALLFFGPLYLLSTYGFKSAGIIAIAAFLGVLVYRQNHGGLAFS